MRLGRPVPGFVLSPAERTTLEQYARRPTTAQALALGARIVLRCATGATHTAIAADLGVTIQTVGKWRTRFVATRIAGLLDEPRPGAPRKITDAQIERAIATTLESTPRDATHWSLGLFPAERRSRRAPTVSPQIANCCRQPAPGVTQ